MIGLRDCFVCYVELLESWPTVLESSVRMAGPCLLHQSLMDDMAISGSIIERHRGKVSSRQKGLEGEVFLVEGGY